MPNLQEHRTIVAALCLSVAMAGLISQAFAAEDAAQQKYVPAGTGGGITARQLEDKAADLVKRLRKENFELRRSNDILQAAATFFGAELHRRAKK